MITLTIYQMDNIVAKINELQEVLEPMAREPNSEFFFPLPQMVINNTDGLKLRVEKELKVRLEGS